MLSGWRPCGELTRGHSVQAGEGCCRLFRVGAGLSGMMGGRWCCCCCCRKLDAPSPTTRAFQIKWLLQCAFLRHDRELGMWWDTRCQFKPLADVRGPGHKAGRSRGCRPRGAHGAHGALGHVCTATPMSPDAHVALQVTTSLRFKTWGYVLQHGVHPGRLAGHSVRGARAAPSWASRGLDPKEMNP